MLSTRAPYKQHERQTVLNGATDKQTTGIRIWVSASMTNPNGFQTKWTEVANAIS